MKKSFKKIISTVLLIAMLMPSLSTNAFAVSIDTIIGRETEKFEERNKDIRSKYFEQLQDATKLLMKGDDDLNDVEIDDGEIEENKGEVFGDSVFNMSGFMYSILPPEYVTIRQSVYKHWDNYPDQILKVYTIKPEAQWMDEIVEYVKKQTGSEKVYVAKDVLENYDIDEKFVYPYPTIPKSKFPNANEELMVNLTARAAYEEDTGKKILWCDDNKFPYATPLHLANAGFFTTTEDDGKTYIHFIQNTTQGLSRRLQYERLATELWQVKFDLSVISNYWEKATINSRVKLSKDIIFRQDGYNTAPKAHVIKPRKAADFYKALGLNKAEIKSINLGWGSDHRPKDAYEIINYYSDLEVEGNWSSAGNSSSKLDPVEGNGVNAALLYTESLNKFDVYLFGMYNYWRLDGSSYGIYWDLSDIKEEIKEDTGLDITKHYGDVTWVTGDNVTWTNEKAKFDQYEQGTEHPLPTNNDLKRTNKEGYELCGWYINDDNTLYQSIPATQTGKITLTASWRRRIKIPKELIYREDGFNTAPKAHVIKPKQAKDFYSVLGLNKEEINSINLGWDSNHRPKSAYELIDYYSDLEVEGDWQGRGRTETKLDPVEANGVNAALLYNEASKKYDVYLFGMYALWSVDGRSYGIYWDLSDVEEEIKTDTGIDITKHYGQVTWVIGDDATWTNERAKFDQYELATSHPLPTKEDITKKGYVLDGWFINNDKNTKYTSIPATQTGNITLTANWITKFINIPKEMISAGDGKININLDKDSWKSQLGLDNYYDIVKITDEPFDTTGLTLEDTILYQSKDYKSVDVKNHMATLLATEVGNNPETILCAVDGKQYNLYNSSDEFLKLEDESYDFLINKDFNAKVYVDDKGNHYILLNQQKELEKPNNWSFHYFGRRIGDNMHFYLRWNFGNINIPQYVDIPKKLIAQNYWNIFITPEKDSWKTQLGLDKYDKIVKITSDELTEEGLTLVETINYKSSEYRTLVAQKDIANAISCESTYYQKPEEIVAKSDNEELNLFTTKAYSDNYDFLIDLKFNAEVYKDKQGYHYVKMNDRKIVKAPSGYRFAYHQFDPISKDIYITWNLGNITPDPDTRLKVGDRVVFGTKKNELHWTVIDKKDDKVLLLYVDPPKEGGIFGEGSKTNSHHIMLTYWPYDGVRQSLNSELYNDYFTEVEKAQILTTHLSNEDPEVPDSKLYTDDKIFALSLDEYNTYKSVIPQFLFDGELDTGSFNVWGLRTRGHDTSNPNKLYNYVVRGTSGTAYVYPRAYNRPAMWVDFDGIVAVNDTEKESTNKIKLPKEIIFREDGFNTAESAHVIRPKKASDFYGVLGLEKDKIGSINLGWDADHRPITAYKIIDYYSDLQVEGSWSSGQRKETKLDPVEANGVNAVLFHNESNDKYDVYLFGMYAYWSLDGRSYGIYWDLSDVIDEVKTDTGIDLSSKYGDVTWVEGEGATWINKDAKFEHYELGTTRALPTKDDIKRDKYELDGWFINEDKTTKHTFIPKAQTGNITLTANWKAIEQPTSSEEASTTKEETTASPSDATEESTKIEDATTKADESSKESSSEESSKESTKEGEQSSEQESASQTVAEEETTSEEETTKDSGNKKTATDSETDESTTESTNEGGNTQGGGVAPSENVDPITYSLFWDWTTKVEWNFTKAYEDNNDTNSYVYGIDYILPLKSEITVLTDGYEFESWTISGDYLEETENATKIPAGTTGGIILKPVFSHEEVPHTKYTMPNTWYERFGFNENKENIKEIHFVDNLDDITNIKEQKVIDDTTPTTDPTVAPTQATTEEAPTEASTEESTQQSTEPSTQPTTAAPVPKKVGDSLYFGSFDPNNHMFYENWRAEHPLSWTVIDKEEDKALLLYEIHKYEDTLQFFTRYVRFDVNGRGNNQNQVGKTNVWADSDARINDLNIEFYNNYFTEEERKKILTTHLTNENNPVFGTYCGPDTDDKIFILSYKEFIKYKNVIPSLNELWPNSDSRWGLRTLAKPAEYGGEVVNVYANNETNVQETNTGLAASYPLYRPAMWVDISVLNDYININNSTLMAPKSNDSEVYAFTGTETATNETVNKTYAKAIITNDNVLYVAPGENVDLTIDGNASNFFGHTYKGKFTNATVIDGLDKLDFSNTTNMHNFFAYCEKLKSVDVSSLNTSKATDMSQMFFDCKAITSLDLSTLDTKKVENMTEMFKNMSSLITIYVSKDDMDKSALTNSKDMFINDTKLVGGEGTAYDANVVDKTYANIDRKRTNGTKGYFTVKGNEPYTPEVTEDASYDIIWDLQGATFKDEYKSIYENAKHTTKEDYILPGEEVLNIPYANIFKNWTVDGVATTSISKNIHKAVTVTANVVRAVSSYETYSIGTYKQESNEPSNIEWVVLEKKDGKLLLTTKNIIDNKSYDEQGKSNFTQSSIKQWLNDDFYKDAFTKEQQDKILDTTLSGNQKAKVFLLTEDEVSAYYPEDVLRIARATNYAMQADNDGEKLSTRNNNIAGYWLMTSENTEDTPYVSNTGKIVETGEKADANHIGVRPCIWVTEKEVKEIRTLSLGNIIKEIGKQIDTFFRFMGFFSNDNKKGK